MVGKELLHVGQVVGGLARREIARETAPFASDFRADERPCGGLALRCIALRQDQRSAADRSGVAYVLWQKRHFVGRFHIVAHKAQRTGRQQHPAEPAGKERARASIGVANTGGITLALLTTVSSRVSAPNVDGAL